MGGRNSGVRSVFTQLFEAGTAVSPNTVVFLGSRGFSQLADIMPAVAEDSARIQVLLTRVIFRESALALIQVLHSDVHVTLPVGDPDRIYLVLAGKAGAENIFEPEAMRARWLFDGSQRLEWTLRNGMAVMVISVPAAVLGEYVDGATMQIRIEDPRTSVDQAIAGFTLSIVNDRAALAAHTPVATYAIDRFLQEMVQIVLVEDRGASDLHSGSRQRFYLSAVALIAERYRDSDLSIQNVASILNVSVRALQQSFQDAGTSFSTELRNQRARAARSLLMRPEFDVLTLTEIADHCGYRSVRGLRDELKQKFGVTPRGIRHARNQG